VCLYERERERGGEKERESENDKAILVSPKVMLAAMKKFVGVNDMNLPHLLLLGFHFLLSNDKTVPRLT